MLTYIIAETFNTSITRAAAAAAAAGWSAPCTSGAVLSET
jgi:hypothetical protein